MILVDWQIHEWAVTHHGIYPYEKDLVNPASIDLRVGMGWLDVQYPKIERIGVPVTVYQLTFGTLLRNTVVDFLYKFAKNTKILRYRRPTAVLLTTFESVALPKDIAGQIKLKSTPTREGLGHPIADWVDNGFMGQLTLMVTANKTVTIWPGDRLCQLVLHRTKIPNIPYEQVGHYYNQTGVTASWRQQDENE